MSSKVFRRYVAVGVLAALTSLAGAPAAQAKEMGLAGRAWQWVQETWRFDGLNLLSRPASKAPRTMEKSGPGLDPNGKPTPSSPACIDCSDLGHGIDPNG
jgi:hypothetical protein